MSWAVALEASSLVHPALQVKILPSRPKGNASDGASNVVEQTGTGSCCDWGGVRLGLEYVLRVLNISFYVYALLEQHPALLAMICVFRNTPYGKLLRSAVNTDIYQWLLSRDMGGKRRGENMG